MASGAAVARSEPRALEAPDVLPDCPTSEQIQALAEQLRAIEAAHGPMKHGTLSHLHGDLYARSVFIEKGTLGVGAVHKIAGFAVCVGDITSWTTAGRQRFTGMHLIQSMPGARVVFAHEDTTWFTIHPNKTGADDIAAIEDSIVENAGELLSRRAQEVLQ